VGAATKAAHERAGGVTVVMPIDRNGLREMLGAGAQLVDVLSTEDYETEHIPSAVNIPLKTLGRETARRLDSVRPVIVYCHDYQ
jgi:rhodanese-related sulfurtransferase